MSPYLEIRNLRLERPAFSFVIPELRLERGEFFGILGRSGAGKSTLLKLLAGLIRPSAGEIHVAGRNIGKLPPHARKIGYLFQSPVLFEHLTVYNNLAMLLKVRRIPRPNRPGLIKTALDLAQAGHLAERRPDSLSGGEKQRAALAAAIMLEPDLLLLDEPFASLDPELRMMMRELARSLALERKITTMFVTHDKEEAFQLFDRLILLDQGKILQQGSPRELYEQPSSPAVAGFFGSSTLLHGRCVNGRFMAANFCCPLPYPDCPNLCLAVPPHALSVVSTGLPATVANCRYAEGRYQVDLDNGLTLYHETPLTGEINLRLNPDAVSIFPEAQC